LDLCGLFRNIELIDTDGINPYRAAEFAFSEASKRFFTVAGDHEWATVAVDRDEISRVTPAV